MTTRPTPHTGMHHLALNVKDLDGCLHFYVDLLGMKIIWQPDPDNIYLSSGSDNVALHRAKADPFEGQQHLDHLGFFVATPTDVDAWHAFMQAQGAAIKAAPRDHRDGTRSFYCADPDGNVVQMIYCPPAPSSPS